VKATKVFQVEFDADDLEVMDTVLKGMTDYPVARSSLVIILDRVHAGVALKSREVEDMRVCLENWGEKSKHAKQMNRSMWGLIR
jgi:hypothetical protein